MKLFKSDGISRARRPIDERNTPKYTLKHGGGGFIVW